MRRVFTVAQTGKKGGVVTSRIKTDVFLGYDARLEVRDGAMNGTKNLSTERFPTLSNRRERGVVRALTAPGGLIEKDAPAWADNGTLYYNGHATPVTGLTAGEKQLVSFGAYIVIFPDKVFFNTADAADYGSLEASYTSSGAVAYSLCRADGTDYESVQVGDEEPSSTSIDVWISTAGGMSVAMSYSASYGGWVELGTVYTKLTFTSQGQIPALFSEGDGVTISGASFDQANGEKILYAVGGSGETGHEAADYVVVVGLLENAYTQTSGSVKIERRTPDMDYVCEAQNRLWGCFYGNDGEKNVNEIYCCALGDFKNWRQFRGLSTDSWAAGVGSDGQWTGAVNYRGNPTFFKENRIHQVSVSAVGAHAVQEIVCRGVQKGSAKSLVVVNETLYYKSRADVCAWQGGFPASVSDALGEEKYCDAVGGAFGRRYYLSMRGASGWSLFVYDIARGLWIREDALHVMQFATVDDELYAIDADGKKLLALRGTVGTLEETVSWEAVTGIMAWEYPDQKYLSRFNLRLKMAEGAEARIFLRYDSAGDWVDKGRIVQMGVGTVMVPIRPRRCDHLQMKISGTGDVQILSVTRELEIGSDA